MKDKPKATKCSDHRTLSFDANTAKEVARILRRRTGSNWGYTWRRSVWI